MRPLGADEFINNKPLPSCFITLICSQEFSFLPSLTQFRTPSKVPRHQLRGSWNYFWPSFSLIKQQKVSRQSSLDQSLVARANDRPSFVGCWKISADVHLRLMLCLSRGPLSDPKPSSAPASGALCLQKLPQRSSIVLRSRATECWQKTPKRAGIPPASSAPLWGHSSAVVRDPFPGNSW